MFQKDTILRLIQQVIDSVLKLLKLVNNQDDKQFFTEFNAFLKSELELSVADINQQNAKEISD